VTAGFLPVFLPFGKVDPGENRIQNRKADLLAKRNKEKARRGCGAAGDICAVDSGALPGGCPGHRPPGLGSWTRDA